MLTRLRYLYRAYRYRYRVDPAELRYIGRWLRPGQVAVDAGCHKGAYTYWLRRCVGPAGRVWAFEPQPRQVDYLRRVFAAMHYQNVTLLPQGLSSAPGRMQLHIPAGAGMTHAASLEQGARSTEQGGEQPPSDSRPSAPCSLLTVDVTTLDAVFAHEPRGPDFVKIDVEGHELAVLEGARQTLARSRPTLLLECEARHRADGQVRPVFELLQSLGYEGRFFGNGQLRPLAEFDPARHQQCDPASPELPPGYVNNFAFEHPGRGR